MPDDLTPDDRPGTVKDDSGEHALHLLTGHPAVDDDGGVIGHLHRVDAALYAQRHILTPVIVALLVLASLALLLDVVLTVRRSHDLAQLREATEAIIESERVNQDLNRRMLEALGRVEGSTARVEASSAAAEAAASRTDAYVQQAQAAQAAGQGQNAEVARRLLLIDQIAAALGIDPNPQPAPEG